MNYSLNIINEILGLLKTYDSDKSDEKKNLKDFIIWLNEKVFDEEIELHSKGTDNSIDLELTFLLIMQNKYYKMYCKEAFLDTQISSPDEYSFLYHLCLVDSFRKMELINMHMLEAPSGIEVIKRLLKKGFIEEFDDMDDRRAKRIRITKKGKKETEKIEPRMKEVYSKMTADMTYKEKLHVISYLKKLNDFHNKKKG